MVRGTVRCGMVCGVARYVISYVGMMCMMVRFNIFYGKVTVGDMVCWWYGMVVRCGGYILRQTIASWYGIFQYIRSLRVECNV